MHCTMQQCQTSSARTARSSTHHHRVMAADAGKLAVVDYSAAWCGPCKPAPVKLCIHCPVAGMPNHWCLQYIWFFSPGCLGKVEADSDNSTRPSSVHPDRPVLPAGKVIGPVYQQLSHQYPDVSRIIHIARFCESHHYTLHAWQKLMCVRYCSVLNVPSSPNRNS